MNSIHEEILQNLNHRLLQQTVVINTLCNILVDSKIISQKKLQKLIDSNLDSVEEQLKELEKKEKDDEIVSQILTNYMGPMGQA